MKNRFNSNKLEIKLTNELFLKKRILLNLFLILILFSQISLTSQTQSKNRVKLVNCGPLCLECEDNDANQCNVCRSGVYQYNSRCFTKCPDGTYTDEEWQVCRECDSDCPICWGPLSDMCGSKKGVMTQVVIIEDEIKKYFLSKKFNESDLIKWMFKLNIILKKNKNSSSIDLLAPQDVYNTNKIDIELPIGSFSKNGGVFIPIPSYLTSTFELVNSHWIFVKGMWDGSKWNEEWFPKTPSFIKYKGEKNKIYYENMGFWIYDMNKGNNSRINLDWIWNKTTKIKDAHISNEDLLSELNSIKFDVIYAYN